MSMNELDVLKEIVSYLAGIKVELGGIGLALWLMLLFKNMGSK